jgi:membrane protein YdbS with pleckstrin-like domain
MKTSAVRLTATAITAVLAVDCGVVALGFWVRAVGAHGDWLDVAGAAVWTVIAVGCAHLIPRGRP